MYFPKARAAPSRKWCRYHFLPSSVSSPFPAPIGLISCRLQGMLPKRGIVLPPKANPEPGLQKDREAALRGATMLPDALPQLIETLLHLPHLDEAQLRELIQNLPDPQASAQEMVRRGWITQNQFSSLFPDPQQRPTHRETTLVGFGDDEFPPDEDSHKWDLIVSDEEDRADVPPEVESARPGRIEEEMQPEPETVEAIPVLAAAESTPQCEGDVPAPVLARGNKARRRESNTHKPLRQWSVLGEQTTADRHFVRQGVCSRGYSFSGRTPQFWHIKNPGKSMQVILPGRLMCRPCYKSSPATTRSSTMTFGTAQGRKRHRRPVAAAASSRTGQRRQAQIDALALRPRTSDCSGE